MWKPIDFDGYLLISMFEVSGVDVVLEASSWTLNLLNVLHLV